MIIYFDMDKVLANFYMPGEKENKGLNSPSEKLSPEKRKEKKLAWLKIEQDSNYWKNVPVMPNIEYLLSVAHNMGEMFVLTKLPGADKFVGGQKYVNFVADEKRKWIATHLGDFFDEKHIIICDDKKGELIHPKKTDILIDDRVENIKEWESHGGSGLWFINQFNAVNQLSFLYKILSPRHFLFMGFLR